MKKIDVSKLINFEDHKRELLKNKEVKKLYDEMEYEFTLINAILEQRNKKGVTQKQLAEKMGTKQSAIARFESGNSNPTLSFLKRLSEALGLELSIKVVK